LITKILEIILKSPVLLIVISGILTFLSLILLPYRATGKKGAHKFALIYRFQKQVSIYLPDDSM
jgi:hypothetical protein